MSLVVTLQQYLERQNFLIIDGGLATELERRGADLSHPLWSASLLLENPSLIHEVHFDFLEAGADVIVSASYQASFPGFDQLGLSYDRAAGLMQESVSLACQARDVFCESHLASGRIRPLVAASIGPYGAYLADGSEYHGHYGVTRKALMDFHRPRMEVLARTEADLFAMETIPSLEEAEVLAELLDEFDGTCAWLSYSCKDDAHVSHGEVFSDCAGLADRYPQIIAVGVNCTKPDFVADLLRSAEAVDTPLLAYPNSGEIWDANARCWTGQGSSLSMASEWIDAGARLVGGCCRVGPEAISKLRKSIVIDAA